MSMRQIHDVEARVISLNKVRGKVYNVCLMAPEVAAIAKPMQFVNVTVGGSTDPLLRRPFSLSAIDAENGIIEITWAVVGRGTKMMAGWAVGQSVGVLGPLGNGLDMNKLPLDRGLVLVAGGTGLAPLMPLASQARKTKTKTIVFYGARSANELLDTTCLEQGCQLHIATEDGSVGFKGLVTDLLETHLGSVVRVSAAGKATVISCGPNPMLNQAKQICNRYGFPLLVSLEERMACGYGLCQGCAVQSSGHKQEYYHVCTDGPVFWADDINLGECMK